MKPLPGHNLFDRGQLISDHVHIELRCPSLRGTLRLDPPVKLSCKDSWGIRHECLLEVKVILWQFACPRFRRSGMLLVCNEQPVYGEQYSHEPEHDRNCAIDGDYTIQESIPE
jgi:hypothetical protein